MKLTKTQRNNFAKLLSNLAALTYVIMIIGQFTITIKFKPLILIREIIILEIINVLKVV